MADRRNIRDPARVVPGRPLDYQLGGESATTKHIYKVLGDLQTQLTLVETNAALAGGTSVNIKVTDYTIVSTDGTVMGDTTASSFTFTLPTAVGVKGKTYTIKNIGDPAHDLTVAARTGELVENASDLIITVTETSLVLLSDGSGWRIVAAYQPSLSAGEAVAGLEPPLEGSGGEGWLSALWVEMREVRKLLEMMLVNQMEKTESEEEK